MQPLNKRWIDAFFVAVLTVLLYVVAYPPYGYAEAIYLGLLPFIMWSYARPTLKRYAWVAFSVSWIVWALLIVWLAKVTIIGWIALSLILSFFGTIWLLLLYWLAGTLLAHPQSVLRLLGVLSLAACWAFLEWARMYVGTGFPWASLAASQWERPVVLQLASWTGFYGVSFVIVFFNLCIAGFLRQRFVLREKQGLSWELFLGFSVLAMLIFWFVKLSPSMRDREPLFSAALIQPYIPASLKWTQEQAIETLEVLEVYTYKATQELSPEVIIWPEAAPPAPINGDSFVGEWIESLAQELAVPIVTGSLSDEEGHWYNGIFVVDPEKGIQASYYAKRRRVPFGEYVPFRDYVWKFVDKIVPLPEDILASQEASLMDLSIHEKIYRLGGLICYEDVFARIARQEAMADVFIVVTNDSWFGEKAGAFQHAAESVLRAVENGRPFVRCGNGGWSGWIDERGNIREVLQDQYGSIYFRGYGLISVSREKSLKDVQTVYSKYGDWFAWVSLLVTIFGVIISFLTSRTKRERL